MNDISELIVSGTICQQCGSLIDDGETPGPRSCEHCMKMLKKERKARRRRSPRR